MTSVAEIFHQLCNVSSCAIGRKEEERGDVSSSNVSLSLGKGEPELQFCDVIGLQIEVHEAMVNDDEVEAIIPSAAYALAKIHMHLVVSGLFSLDVNFFHLQVLLYCEGRFLLF
ncbi:hypothetical protein MA16_Dca019748 [Dendrobium catenatum]|uniref:Uncharacterized protein n=1 Tax=Dendrobium catenatum TaxID=906689 RepID=A0A2I0VQT3_9ASPA|nr:hypothetical protein MA16_Dca019748 [Dendrobium catenatum]